MPSVVTSAPRLTPVSGTPVVVVGPLPPLNPPPRSSSSMRVAAPAEGATTKISPVLVAAPVQVVPSSPPPAESAPAPISAPPVALSVAPPPDASPSVVAKVSRASRGADRAARRRGPSWGGFLAGAALGALVMAAVTPRGHAEIQQGRAWLAQSIRGLKHHPSLPGGSPTGPAPATLAAALPLPPAASLPPVPRAAAHVGPTEAAPLGASGAVGATVPAAEHVPAAPAPSQASSESSASPTTGPTAKGAIPSIDVVFLPKAKPAWKPPKHKAPPAPKPVASAAEDEAPAEDTAPVAPPVDEPAPKVPEGSPMSPESLQSVSLTMRPVRH